MRRAEKEREGRRRERDREKERERQKEIKMWGERDGERERKGRDRDRERETETERDGKRAKREEERESRVPAKEEQTTSASAVMASSGLPGFIRTSYLPVRRLISPAPTRTHTGVSLRVSETLRPQGSRAFHPHLVPATQRRDPTSNPFEGWRRWMGGREDDAADEQRRFDTLNHLLFNTHKHIQPPSRME
jgi:hypothetical protein